MTPRFEFECCRPTDDLTEVFHTAEHNQVDVVTAATRELLEKYDFYKQPEEEVKEEEK